MGLQCIVCTHPLDMVDRSPYVGTCGHTLCQMCINAKTVILRCPICMSDGSFKRPQINYQLMESLEELKQTHHNWEVTRLQKQEVTADYLLISNKVNDLEEALAQKDLQIKDLSTLLNTATVSWTGSFACSECKFPMKEKLSMLCLDCMKEDVGKTHEDGSVEFVDYQKSEARLICCGCEKYGPHAEHVTKPYHLLKVTQNTTRLKSELISQLDDSVCGNSAICGGFVEATKIGNDLKEVVAQSCDRLRDCDSWKDFEDEEVKLKALVKAAIVHHELVVASLSKYNSDMQGLIKSMGITRD